MNAIVTLFGWFSLKKKNCPSKTSMRDFKRIDSTSGLENETSPVTWERENETPSAKNQQPDWWDPPCLSHNGIPALIGAAVIRLHRQGNGTEKAKEKAPFEV